MLAARRDPIFDHGAHHAPASTLPGHAGGHAAPPPTGFTRFISGLQILGTVLGIPLGLASGYSIYHANFSVEARCHSLRGNIVAMLDKNIDAATLRMLVRRDALTFEQSCGSVDPNAVAAFRTLLSTNKLAKPAAVAQSVPKPPAKPVKQAKSAARPLHRQAASSDTRWLAAVREALVRRPAAPQPAERSEAVRPTPVIVAPPRQAAPVLSAPVASSPPVAPDHPVPPALIPDASSAMQAQSGTRLGALMAHLPLVGGVFGR